MTKICGFLTAEERLGDEVRRDLGSMLAAMRHERGQSELSVVFPGGRGGLAVLQYPFGRGSSLGWSRDGRVCAGLAGHVVGFLAEGEGCGVPAGEDPYEVVCQGWQRWGEELPGKLNGVFSLAVYEQASGSLFVAGDRYGFFPLYYRLTERGLWFASEVKALLPLLPSVEPDWKGWADFFYVGHMMGTRTLVRGVDAIDSGQWIRFGPGGATRTKYFDFTRVPPAEPDGVSVDEVAERFRRAVARRADPDSAHTVLLSGGFDSRLTLGALCELGVTPRLVSLEHADEHRGLDGRLAVEVARSLGLECELRPTRPDYYGSKAWREVFRILDGMVPNRGLFIAQVYGELDSSMGTVWDSLALDMSLGGYHGYDADPETNLARFVSARERFRPVLQALLDPEAFRQLDEGFDERLRAMHDAVPESPNRFILFLIQHRIRRRIAVNPYQLYASRVKPTSPTVDAEFLDYVLAIPNDRKLGHRLYLEMLRRHFPRLLEVPACSAGEIFMGWKAPLLIARHYDWKFGLKGWLSGRPRLKRPLLRVRDAAGRVLRAGEARQGAQDPARLPPWVRSAGEGIPGHLGRTAQQALGYLSLWYELFGSRSPGVGPDGDKNDSA